MTDFNSIDSHDVLARIGDAGAPHIVDICVDEDHALDPRIIPGAQRVPFREAAVSDALIHGSVVIVCQRGLKLSQGVAASLRARGGQARYLEGGHVGWAQAGLPLLPMDLDPLLGQVGRAWAVPHDICPDDIVQAWIVRRFVDRGAEWWAVARDQVDAVAQRFDAGTLATADRIATYPGPLFARFEKLSQSLANPAVTAILKAHVAAGDFSGPRMQAIFPVIDALWTMTGDTGA